MSKRKLSTAAFVAASLIAAVITAPATASASNLASTPPVPKPSTVPLQSPQQRQRTQEVQDAVIHNGKASLIVTMKSSTSLAVGTALAHSRNLPVVRTLDAVHAFSVSVPAAQLGSTVTSLRAEPGVRSVDVNVARYAFDVPTDPDYATDQATYFNAIDAPAAWTTQKGSAAVHIAIIDSGVDVTNPDLVGKVAATYNAVDGSTDVTDTVGHGTFAAGVAAAATDNTPTPIGIAGAGWNTSLYAVKVAAADGTFSVEDEIAGINWAVGSGANVISISLGGDVYIAAEAAAIANAESHGVLVVAAAGNDGTNVVNYPAGYPGVIAVGASSTDGTTRAPFSQFGPWVSVAAPGVGIWGTTPIAASDLYPAGVEFASDSGTSFSTPLVAAEAALLKAQQPSASATQLRAAIIDSAHGLAGQQLGAGLVDYNAAISHLPPTTAPAAPTQSGTTNLITLSTTSSAAKVQFLVDGHAVGGPVAVSSGAAAVQWDSNGQTNGAHTVTAEDCTAFGECATSGASASISVANTAPALTAPANGQLVTGSFNLTASGTAGAGAEFLIDGVRHGFAAASPYAATYSGSLLSNGTHTLAVRACNAAGTVCSGPSSASRTFVNSSLHPTVASVAPSHFSPNGDRVDDTSTITVRLGDTESVAVAVVNAAGAVVRGPVSLGGLHAGTHAWVWNGAANNGSRAPDGSYTYSVTSSQGRQRGLVTAKVAVDTTPPALTTLTQSTGTFYPVPDGFEDNYTVTVTSSEAGTLRLAVTTAAGIPVLTPTASKPAGRVSISWSGTNSTGHHVAPGVYHWRLLMTDAAGNTAATAVHGVTVSSKKLVLRSATISETGAQLTESDSDPTTCTQAQLLGSALVLGNFCNPNTVSSFIDGIWAFHLPTELKYGSMRLSIQANALAAPAPLFAAMFRTDGSVDFSANPLVRTNGLLTWSPFPYIGISGHVLPGNIIDAAAVLTNDDGPDSQIEIRKADLNFTYYVLG